MGEGSAVLRSEILDELSLSERIVRDGHEVVPRFRIIAPDGEHTMMVQLPDDLAARNERMQVVRAFMIWKAATAFVQSTELIEPNAIASVAVTRAGAIGALRRITCKPMVFGEFEWFGRESVDDEIVALLPPRSLTLTDNDLHFIDQAFACGEVPGIRWVRPGEQV